MKRIIRVSIFVIAVFFYNSTYSLSESDFQFKAALVTEGKHPMYQTIIPFRVYQGIKRNGMGDIRVLNADGVELPHAIRNFKIKRSTYHKSMSLPLFPIRGSQQRENKDLSVSIGKNSTGTLVKVSSSDKKGKKSKVTMYIVDASKLKYHINALKFDWTTKTNTNVKSLQIEKSNDLKNWQFLKNGTITKLKYMGHQLNRDSISVSPQKARYLRISWKNFNNEFLIKSIHAQYYNIKIKKQISPRTRILVAKKHHAPENDPQFVYYQCNINALAPISDIEFTLPYDNMAVNARLLTKHTYWDYDYRRKKRYIKIGYKPIWKGLLYNIKTKKGRITNKKISIQLHGERRFFIKLPKSAIPKNLEQLQVKIHWTPHKLLFIAQGTKPYTLVYGSDKVEPSRFDFNSLAQLIKTTHGKTFKAQLAQLGKTQKNASFIGNSKKTGDPTAATKWILWAVLLLGVVFLGFMSRKIAKQINTNSR